MGASKGERKRERKKRKKKKRKKSGKRGKKKRRDNSGYGLVHAIYGGDSFNNGIAACRSAMRLLISPGRITVRKTP